MEQIVKLTGRIAKVMPAQSGISSRTGERWMSQEYVFEYFQWSGARYPSRIVMRVFGEDTIKQFALKEMEEDVTVTLRFDAHEYNGRWFNEVGCTDVKRQSDAQQSTDESTIQQSAAQPQATSPVIAPEVQTSETGTDGLPF